MSTPQSAATHDRASTGIAGLDEILEGGLPSGHLYLIEGESGAGKTTLGLQFLLEGQRRGERLLWVTLSETTRELEQIAASHGWTLDGIDICNPARIERALTSEERYSFFSPADVELDEMRNRIFDVIRRDRPARVVFDPFSDVRHLSRDLLRYRREVLALREFLAEQSCTVLLMQELTRGTPGDLQAEALVHGYLTMHQDSPEYGGQRRRLRVHKMRGMRFREGFHDFAIHTGGIEVYPRLVAAEHYEPHAEEAVSSGLGALDTLLGGGVDRGSSLLILGAAGVGKSTIAAQYAVAAAERGEKAAFFIFDETERTRIGLPLERYVADKTIVIRQIDSAEMSPGQLAHAIMHAVDADGASLIVIDSLSGYLGAMPEERFLSAHLHELLTYLNHRNVVTLLTLAQHGIVGEQVSAPVDISYLADSVLMIRYFEAFGAVRRAISVVKKRSGDHEVHVRELLVSSAGIAVGEPIAEFHGVLTGRPVFVGAPPRPNGT
jgi:circadian clock protein KaiC